MSLAGQISLLATRVGQEIKADRASLALKAPVLSPGFQGVPTSTTPSAGDSSTKVATTAFVAAALGSYLTTTSAASTYAPLSGPQFTGIPKAPTAAAGTNTTQLATTAFVAAALGSYLTTASAASTYAALTGGAAFTGISPTAPTPTVGDNTTRIATTAFVGQAIASQAASDQGAFAPKSGPTFSGVVTIASELYTGGSAMKLLGAPSADFTLDNDGSARIWSNAILNRTYTSAQTTPNSTDQKVMVITSSGTIGCLGGTSVLYHMQAYSDVISTRAVYVNSSGRLGTTTSSKRVKDLRQRLTMDDAALRKWLDLPVWEFSYKPEVLPPEDKNERGRLHHGFVAEDVEAAGFETLLYREEREGHPNKGRVEGFAYEKMGVYNHLALQRQQQIIKDLTARIAILEGTRK